MNHADKLLGPWGIQSPCCYLFAIFLSTMAIRIVACFFRTLQLHPHLCEFGRRFGRNLGGFCRTIETSAATEQQPDFWLPTLVGTFELAAYPILMRFGAWNFIGAWLTFKTIARLNLWREDRGPFNRYLLNNALVLGVSILFLVNFVDP
jgi:hypothetical protein